MSELLCAECGEALREGEACYFAGNAYCKHDGSLNDGFEIVTHPMTLDYHLHRMPWEELLEKDAPTATPA